MVKFKNIQRLSSVIPVWSTVIIAIITMIKLRQNNASKRLWFYFIITFFVSGIVAGVVNAFVMSGQHLILNILVTGLILAIANLIFVDLQCLCEKESTTAKGTGIGAKLLVGLIGGFLFVVVCISFFCFYFKPTPHIEDTNGPENTNLVTMAHDDIAISQDHYTAFKIHTSNDGSNTNVSERLYKEDDYEECKLKCEKISGIYTLQATKTNCNQLMLEFISQLEKGNMEIVIVVDDQFYASIPVNQEYLITLNDIAGKTVLVKIAAESAKMDAYVKRVPF